MAAAAVMTSGDPHAATDMKPTLTPPPTEKIPELDDLSSSELSELEDDDDIGEIEPDYYYEGGKIPVFKPTMDQFRSFKKFVGKIDKYGMKSGIVKVIPPKEWRDSLPALDEAVKTIKVKNPITQEIVGNHGTYRQANIEKQRSYNLPQWRQLSDASDHQPPARRGERRRNQEVIPRSNAKSAATQSPGGKKKRPGRSKETAKGDDADHGTAASKEDQEATKNDRPPTPKSPISAKGEDSKMNEAKSETPVKEEQDEDDADQANGATPTKSKGRQPKSVSSRRKYNRRAAADVIDEAAFESFDYRISNQEAYTPERCDELERHYWKSLTYNSPLYGADMPGSLFDNSTTSWNVAKLENLLDVLGQKVPGVNTAYLYLGMWKSTFAWHLEDVDLYSINYIHFGAPKQWYSISQEDARRFEAAMKSVWPNDAKQCSQFLRHKTYLISPSLLQSRFNIRVNRLVHHEGEFVITFPYGYHSGYNLGYNCAESVNFATESWLDYGRVAKKCDCEADSVWIDVNDIERRLRGEETDYEETEDEEGDELDDEAAAKGASDLPTPPESVEGKPKQRVRKRKRDPEDGASKSKVKKIRVRIRAPAKEPCVLCPNDIPSEQLLQTDNGNEAHRLCALYTPETFIDGIPGSETICNVVNIDKARLDLKCNFCRSKRGACFQCSQKKCTRAYHPTCAAAAGVLVDIGDVPVFAEDGTEYTDVGIDFRCRFHRPKRAKQLDGDVLEESELIRNCAKKMQLGDVVQMQYHKGEIFAGHVVENRQSEQMVLVDILPKGHRVEVEYKWILVLDPADSRLPIPSANARPLAAHPAEKKNFTKDRKTVYPVADDPFCDPNGPHVWSEFHTVDLARNQEQVKVDMDRPKAVWYYLGKTSTEARAQFTEDVNKKRHNPEGNFLETVKPPPVITAPIQKKPSSAPRPPNPSTGPNQHALNSVQVNVRQSQQEHQGQYQLSKQEKPYQYKPKEADAYRVDPVSLLSQQAFQQQASGQYSNSPLAKQVQITQSQTPSLFSKTANDIIPHSVISKPETPQQTSTMQQQQAPVANMGQSPAVNSVECSRMQQHNPEPKPFVQEPAVQVPMQMSQMVPTETKNSAPPTSNAKPSPGDLLQHYPYLLRSHLKHASGSYQSPYLQWGGFTDSYLPLPPSSSPLQDPLTAYDTYEAFFAGMGSLAPNTDGRSSRMVGANSSDAGLQSGQELV